MPKPRVLIVDDDRVSLRFLEAAVAQSGCTVVAAIDGAEALQADGTFDLLLIDRHLPDIGGADLLRALRERSVTAPAIATSAEIEAATGSQLRAAGFVDILKKPASAQRITQIVRGHLANAAPALLDDEAALDSIGGDENALRALRSLLAQELERLEHELVHGNLATNAALLRERLHRLRASCGFCGASALAAGAADWQDALPGGGYVAGEWREPFVALCRETAMALRR